MRELVAFVFRDQYRAAEVLNELRRREWDWVADAEDAITVMLDKKGKASVQLNIDLSTNKAQAWARLWGSLLSVTLFLPLTDVMVQAAGDLTTISSAISGTGPDKSSHSLHKGSDARWWRDSLELSEDFIRDVSASLCPAHSAIFMLIRTSGSAPALMQLRDYGDTIIHTPLNAEQQIKINEMLAHQ